MLSVHRLTLFAFLFLVSSLLFVISPKPAYALQGWSCCDTTGIADGNHCDVCGPMMTKSANDQYGCGTNPNCRMCGGTRPVSITCNYDAPSTPQPTVAPTTAPLSCTVTAVANPTTIYPFGRSVITATPVVKNGTVSNVGFKWLSGIVLGGLPVADTTSPYQATVTAGTQTGTETVRVTGTVTQKTQWATTTQYCTANVNVQVANYPAQCTGVKCLLDSTTPQAGSKATCSMSAVNPPGGVPAGGSVYYEGRCARYLGTVKKEQFNLTALTAGSPVFQTFTVKPGKYTCEMRYCVKNAAGSSACMDWTPATI